MLERLLDESYPTAVRRDLTLLTVARTAGVACYRYSPVFLATIARGFDVSLDELGVAVAISETSGLVSPIVGRFVDRMGRRAALVGAMLSMTAAAVLAAVSTGTVVFAIALVLLCQSKIAYDLALGSWIADHVPYERRSRVVGLTETSWALGLLVGVSAMALVTAVASWRWAYAAGAAAVAVMAVAIGRRVEPGGRASHSSLAAAPVGRLDASGRLRVAAALTLMGATQSLVVTFGSWLEDTFGVGALGLGAVTFALGLGELCSSLLSARRTDRWGKERSVAVGAGLMVPAALLLAAWHDQLAVGLVLLAIVVVGFEFAVVSLLATGTQLVPGAPARGLGLLVGAGTLGRAAVSIPATRLYGHGGIGRPALMTAAMAAITAATVLRAGRQPR